MEGWKEEAKRHATDMSLCSSPARAPGGLQPRTIARRCGGPRGITHTGRWGRREGGWGGAAVRSGTARVWRRRAASATRCCRAPSRRLGNQSITLDGDGASRVQGLGAAGTTSFAAAVVGLHVSPLAQRACYGVGSGTLPVAVLRAHMCARWGGFAAASQTRAGVGVLAVCWTGWFAVCWEPLYLDLHLEPTGRANWGVILALLRAAAGLCHAARAAGRLLRFLHLHVRVLCALALALACRGAAGTCRCPPGFTIFRAGLFVVRCVVFACRPRRARGPGLAVAVVAVGGRSFCRHEGGAEPAVQVVQRGAVR